MSFSEPLVWSGVSGRLSTISNSALLACSRLSRRSSVTKPVRRRKMRSKRARKAPARARFQAIGLEIGIVIPDQAADPRLRRAMLVGEGVQLMHQPFRVYPAQRMTADVELSSIITQHHAVAEEFM